MTSMVSELSDSLDDVRRQDARHNVQSIGIHRVRCGDVMDSHGVDVLVGAGRARLFYSDPPWGEGNLRYWQTMNAKMNAGAEAKPVPPLAEFLAQIFRLAQKHVDGPVLVEYGVRWEAHVVEVARHFGFRHYGRATTVYGHPARPLHLHLFQAERLGELEIPGGADAYFAALEGTTAYPTVRTAVGPFARTLAPGSVILDPCCGLGYTAKAAVEFALAFRGNELNAARLAKTVGRLQASTISVG
jgi:hypothetical protein